VIALLAYPGRALSAVPTVVASLAAGGALPRRIARTVAVTVGLMALAAPSFAHAGDVTIMFGRGQLEQVDSNCQPVPNSVSLWSIATDLQSRGMAATLPVTASQIGTAGRLCIGSSVYPTWSDLDTFRDTYGWSMVPRGRTSDSLQNVTDPAKLDANVCGSLKALYDHGHSRAWGMFAWPQNRWTSSEEETYVPRCFAFGRRYASDTTTNALPVGGPYWWARTISINGGRCHDSSLPCHTMQVNDSRDYMQPGTLIATGAKSKYAFWTIFQWYKLVVGTHGKIGDSTAWDCSSSDPAKHWTSATELYCYTDYKSVIATLDPARVTDPAGVALQQGIDKGQ
jgi:hypothetical protein